ncbi:MAG TPA: hypothetical protein VH540_02875 [Ktedonobacterales bacterium]
MQHQTPQYPFAHYWMVGFQEREKVVQSCENRPVFDDEVGKMAHLSTDHRFSGGHFRCFSLGCFLLAAPCNPSLSRVGLKIFAGRTKASAPEIFLIIRGAQIATSFSHSVKIFVGSSKGKSPLIFCRLPFLLKIFVASRSCMILSVKKASVLISQKLQEKVYHQGTKVATSLWYFWFFV